MEPKKFRVFIVKEDSPAFTAIKRSFGKKRLKDGKILPVSDEEFESFKKDFIQLEIHKNNAG
jgi:hypothetical protein